MSDLINRSSLKDRASEYALSEDEYKRFCNIIDAEPTAYNLKKCGECNKYGDLHSSCFKARFLEANPDDAACKDFK